jgi:mannose-6-phosphate isomerase class I
MQALVLNIIWCTYESRRIYVEHTSSRGMSGRRMQQWSEMCHKFPGIDAGVQNLYLNVSITDGDFLYIPLLTAHSYARLIFVQE